MAEQKMPRQFCEKKLLVGTQNPGKIKEFEKLLAPLGIEVISLKGTTLDDPEETGATFVDNALLKAKYYAAACDIPTLADDSGLCIQALDHKPGVHTKHFIEDLGGPKKAFESLEMRLENQEKTASMHCVLGLVWPDGHSETFEGICEGELVFPARYGEGDAAGFGVDPIFQPKGHSKTFSEDSVHKGKVSHRVRAVQLLFEGCFSR